MAAWAKTRKDQRQLRRYSLSLHSSPACTRVAGCASLDKSVGISKMVFLIRCRRDSHFALNLIIKVGREVHVEIEGEERTAVVLILAGAEDGR